MLDLDFSIPDGVHFFERGWLSSNNILLMDEKLCVLVDTGFYAHAHQTLALLEAKLQGRSLDVIINTHLHSDHCGGNAFLQKHFPDVETRIPPGHADFVRHWDSQALGYIGNGQHCPAFSVSRTLLPGDVLHVGAHSWQAYAAPGHDPHSLILFSQSTGVCITADALWESGFGVVFPEIEGADGFDEVSASLDLIESLQPSIIFPGHGAPFTDVKSALTRSRARLRRFMESPKHHALYAAKVLLKFKLLELQKMEVQTIVHWADNASHLHKIHKTFFHDQSFADWLNFICVELVRSDAAKLDSGCLINV